MAVLPHEAPREPGLSARARRLLALMRQLPLVTVRDIAPLLGFSSTVVYDGMKELRSLHLIDAVGLGWYKQRSMRWFLTQSGLDSVRGRGVTWHEESARCQLLDRLPSVEWFYDVIGQVRGLGSFEEFCWLRGRCADAVARYEYGWVALFWSGPFQSENLIRSRLERLAMDLRDLRVSQDVAPWPGMLIFVVSDHWQREVVYRAARRYGLEDQVTVWCAQDGKRSGAREPGVSRGWINQLVETYHMSGWDWKRRLRASPWVARRGVVSGRVFDVISQWPGARLKMLKQSIGESSTGRSAQHACLSLIDSREIHRLWDNGRFRYVTTTRGVHSLSLRDRVHYSDSKRRSESLSWVGRPRLRDHEEGVMNVLGSFLEAGLPVAAGWRSWEYLGSGVGGIAPDGMVFLEQGPFGPTWAYLEYERSARGEVRISEKLNGYGAANRRDDWPVLVVSWNDAAESVFHLVGRRLRIPMLTTTISRIEEHGPVHNDRCWLMYGEPVVVG